MISSRSRDGLLKLMGSLAFEERSAPQLRSLSSNSSRAATVKLLLESSWGKKKNLLQLVEIGQNLLPDGKNNMISKIAVEENYAMRDEIYSTKSVATYGHHSEVLITIHCRK